MTLSFDPETLDSLSRRELQAIAKALAIKANSKTVKIISDLRAYAAAEECAIPVDEDAEMESDPVADIVVDTETAAQDDEEQLQEPEPEPEIIEQEQEQEPEPEPEPEQEEPEPQDATPAPTASAAIKPEDADLMETDVVVAATTAAAAAAAAGEEREAAMSTPDVNEGETPPTPPTYEKEKATPSDSAAPPPTKPAPLSFVAPSIPAFAFAAGATAAPASAIAKTATATATTANALFKATVSTGIPRKRPAAKPVIKSLAAPVPWGGGKNLSLQEEMDAKAARTKKKFGGTSQVSSRLYDPKRAAKKAADVGTAPVLGGFKLKKTPKNTLSRKELTRKEARPKFDLQASLAKSKKSTIVTSWKKSKPGNRVPLKTTQKLSANNARMARLDDHKKRQKEAEAKGVARLIAAREARAKAIEA